MQFYTTKTSDKDVFLINGKIRPCLLYILIFKFYLITKNAKCKDQVQVQGSKIMQKGLNMTYLYHMSYHFNFKAVKNL